MDAVTRSGGKRPKLVWTVFLFFLFSVGYTALSFYLVYSGSVRVMPDQAAFFSSLSVFDHTMTVVIAALNIAGAISLFLLRKIAFHFFAASLIIGILATVVHAMTKNFLVALGGSGAVGMIIGYGISIAVCVYAWKLKARGVLV